MKTIAYTYMFIAEGSVRSYGTNKPIAGADIEIEFKAIGKDGIPVEIPEGTDISDIISVNFRSSVSDKEADGRDIAERGTPYSIRIDEEKKADAVENLGCKDIQFEVFGYGLDIIEREGVISEVDVSKTVFEKILKENHKAFETVTNHKAQVPCYRMVETERQNDIF